MANRTCVYRGCVNPSRSRGLCNLHYLRAWNDGTLDLVAALPTVKERFWTKVRVDRSSGACWLWLAGVCPSGYGRFQEVDGVGTLAHRIAYTWLVGPIPEGLTLDHLCRNTNCVNPHHLEPVTLGENARRSVAWNRGKTHCIRGHEFDEDNTYHAPDGKRACLSCRRDHYPSTRRTRTS